MLLCLRPLDGNGLDWQVVRGNATAIPLENAGQETEIIKQFSDRIAALRVLKAVALAELEEFSPASVKQAKALWPRVLRAECVAEDLVRLVTGHGAPPTGGNPGSDPPTGATHVPEGTAPGDPKEVLRKESVMVLRALKVLAYLEWPVQRLDDAIEKRLGELTEADQRVIMSWFQAHFGRLNAADELAAFAAANLALVARFAVCFPHQSRFHEVVAKPDEQTAKTLCFLIQAEDPGLYRLFMGPEWAYWGREYNRQPGPKPVPVFGSLRMECLKPQLLQWLQLGGDERRFKAAQVILSDQTAPWVREWLEAARNTWPKEHFAELAAPAAGIGDPDLILSLWKETLEKGGNEWSFLWWLRFTQCFQPSLAEFAIHRWEAFEREEAGLDEAHRHYTQLEPYLSSYRRHQAKASERSEDFKTSSEAAAWFKAHAAKP